ncbi:MAG: class I SAM-dependent methyltransferase [Deltaproteobacteria bacterium]|nr:class I SAM-dependent methyltransferase [Deltaproteobacteria bacterium]
MTTALHAYLVAHGTPPDEIQRALIEETQVLGDISIMQIAPEQGAFMTLFAQILGAQRAIEIGTFTGYSALCLARGLTNDGELICCDLSEEWTSVGRRYWEKAGVSHKIDLRIAPAIETLARLPQEPNFDLAFIDADKGGYIAYFEALMPLIRTGGVILVDNVLWMGAVVDAAENSEDTVAIRRFNDLVAADSRVDCVMLPIADGLTLLRKR